MNKKGLTDLFTISRFQCSTNWSHTDHFLCVFFYVYFELDTYYKVFSLLCNPNKKSFVSTKSITTHHCVVNVIDVVCLLSDGVQNDKNHKKRKSLYIKLLLRYGTIHMCMWIWCDIFFALINRQHTNQFFWLSKIQHILYVQ